MSRELHSSVVSMKKKKKPALKDKLNEFIKSRQELSRITDDAMNVIQDFDKEIAQMEQTVRELNRYHPIIGNDGMNLRVLKRWRLTAQTFLDKAKNVRAMLMTFIEENQKKAANGE